MQRLYRFAFDIGTNSIGWVLYILDEQMQVVGIADIGVRIFSDGRDSKNGASHAVDRRLARQARRRRDRFLQRKTRLMNALVRHSLMPENLDERKALELLPPYFLRANGLDEKLSLYELGRAIFHMNQRRGFKSNRKADKGNESGLIKAGMQQLNEELEASGCRSVGEYLQSRLECGLPARVRPRPEKGGKVSYEYYPQRSLLENEFDLLWAAQRAYHPELDDEMQAEIREIIFYQRPLKPVPPGYCSLMPSEHRAPQLLPVAEKARILQNLNHLYVLNPDLRERLLSLEEREPLLERLLAGETITATKLRKHLKLDGTYHFNFENSSQKEIKGSAVAAILGKKDLLGGQWSAFSLGKQTEIVKLLLNEEESDQLSAKLVSSYGLTPEAALRLAELDLPDGYSHHCEQVLEKLVAEMEKDVVSYAEARKAAGYGYKDESGEILPRLPYYGLVLERYVGVKGVPGKPEVALEKLPQEQRFGRIANPTVHIALNQLRRVVNELIKIYGLPAQIVLEVARDLKNGQKAKDEIRKRQTEEKKANDRRRQKLQEAGIKVSADSLLRMRLWEELNLDDACARHCPYTGEPISFTRLFGDDVEVEHILPFSRTLDNSAANKTVSLRRANRDKGNRSPYEAFFSNPHYDWSGIEACVLGLPQNKQWRFAEGAMEQFDKDEAFLARQLSDTQYIARVAREYLCAICNPAQVWVTPGRLTSALAHAWGFGRKNRNIHLHHALDAAIIGVTDRVTLQRAARANAQLDNPRRFFLTGLDEPWPGFREDVLERLDKIIVSHKADHGIGGALHKETAYGMLAPNGQKRNAQHRKPVDSFSCVADLLTIKEIKLRAELLRDLCGRPLGECLEGLKQAEEMQEKQAKQWINQFADLSDKEFKEAFGAIAERRGIRRIRIAETLSLIPIKDKTGRVYKGVTSETNAWYDICADELGKWYHQVVSTYAAHNEENAGAANLPVGHKHVMRLFKKDMLELETDGEKKMFIIVKFSEKGQITLVEHYEANVDKRARDSQDDFKYWSPGAATLQQCNAKAVYITPAGRLIYRRPPQNAAACSGDQRE